MKISYNKLWKLLIDKKMSKADLRKEAGIAPNTMTRLRRDEEVSLSVLRKICCVVEANIGDIMEFLPTKNNSIIAKPLVLCYNKNAPRGARPSRYLQPQSHRSMYPGPCITLLKWIIRFSQAIFQAKWYQTMIPIWYPELWELWEHREKHEFTSKNSLQTTITEGEKEPGEGTPKRVGIIHRNGKVL